MAVYLKKVGKQNSGFRENGRINIVKTTKLFTLNHKSIYL